MVGAGTGFYNMEWMKNLRLTEDLQNLASKLFFLSRW